MFLLSTFLNINARGKTKNPENEMEVLTGKEPEEFSSFKLSIFTSSFSKIDAVYIVCLLYENCCHSATCQCLL